MHVSTNMVSKNAGTNAQCLIITLPDYTDIELQYINNIDSWNMPS